MLSNYVASYSSPVVEELINQGVVILGVQIWMNLLWVHQLRLVTMVNLKPTLMNPVSWGSSGGSSASVISNMALVSLGLILVGLFVSQQLLWTCWYEANIYGTVSRYGLIAMVSII